MKTLCLKKDEVFKALEFCFNILASIVNLFCFTKPGLLARSSNIFNKQTESVPSGQN